MAQVPTEEEKIGDGRQLDLPLTYDLGSKLRLQFLLDELDLVPAATFAAALGLAEQTLNGWRCTGQGPHYVKLGKTVFYRREDIAVWVAKNVTAPST